MLGWDNVFHCEINPFGRQVLEYWFPESDSYEDITKTDFTKYRGQIDVLTGGFPCQPFSYAGKRGGQSDDRYLWPEMLRVIDEVRPTWVVGENVAGITTMVESSEISYMGSEASLFEEGDGVHRFDQNSPSQSNESAEILNQRDIPSSRYLFRLVLSEHHTEETESSLLLITPTTVMTCEKPEKMRERAGKNGTKYGSMESQIMYDPKMKDLLPTPTAGEGVKWTNTYNPSSQMGQSLSAMAGSGMLPTPRACTSMMARLDTEGMVSEKRFPNLEVIIAKMLPTPSARDWKGKTNPGVVKEGSGCIYGETLPDAVERITCDQSEDGKGFRLSPLFSEEMMGFPLMWTTLPFLSPSGETNQ